MGKSVYIAEKPSVAQAFAQALHIRGARADGYLESDDAIVTWCVGHLVTMCYPDAYDAALKKWSLATIPFIPETFQYEVIDAVKKQFAIVSRILNRADVDTIYVCTDAGREGEYIYRLVEMQAKVTCKQKKRVWIDAQTEEEILRGVREAKDLSAYDNLSAAAFLRAKEDYLMGINFSRALTLKYANTIKNYLKTDRCVVSIGRVMTCVLGIVVDREREIRNFVKTPYYGVEADFLAPRKAQDAGSAKGATTANTDGDVNGADDALPLIRATWKVADGSRYAGSPLLYNEKGFREKRTAEALIASLSGEAVVEKVEKKKETKNPPLLYNLAELQNDCARFFKISPDQTLQIAQELYEKKLTTYPRTDARVLSTAIAKEIEKNLTGLMRYEPAETFVKAILQHGTHKTIAKTRYVNDKAVTDHYAIIPTGQGFGALKGLSPTARAVYDCVVRRFLAIFYPPAKFDKLALTIAVPVREDVAGVATATDGADATTKADDGVTNKRYTEYFYANFRALTAKGFYHVLSRQKDDDQTPRDKGTDDAQDEKEQDADDLQTSHALMEALKKIRKGVKLSLSAARVKESETTPPKRYNTGALILTMENAGQFIEDEELRAQIKGSGIGTSATRAEILKKLVSIRYLQLNKKTQIITPTQLGEMVYETVFCSMKPMLNPSLTASWEKGLTGVAEGTISEDEYMQKLDDFIRRRVDAVKGADVSALLVRRFDTFAGYYAGQPKRAAAGGKRRATGAARKKQTTKTTE